MKKKDVQKSITLQKDQRDCGVVCLLSVIRYHGGNISLERLRELSGTSSEGTTLLGLYQAALSVGFDAEGLSADSTANLAEIDEPAILHVVNTNRHPHYIVLYGFQHGKLVIGDPAQGLVYYTHEELESIWPDKVLLKLTPTNSFVKSSTYKREKQKWMYESIRGDAGNLTVSLTLGVVTALLGLSTALYSKKLIDEIIPTADKTKLLLSLAFMILLLVCRSGLSYLRGLFILEQGKDFNNRIVHQFYSTLLSLPKTFFDTRTLGDLTARMNDASRIQATLALLSGNFLIDILYLVASIVFTFLYSSAIGYLILLFIPLYALLALRYSRPLVASQKEVMNSYAHSEAHYIDTMQGIASIKSTGKQKFFESLNQKVYERLQENIFKLGKVNITFSIVAEIIGALFIGIVFGLTAFIALEKKLTTGELVAIIALAGTVVPSLTRLVTANIQIQESKVVIDRMFEFMLIEPELLLSHHATKQSFDSLVLKNVYFSFPGRAHLLRSISLELRKGKITVLLGESGSGKSTLLQILQKFYHPDEGDILLNGLDWKQVDTASWRRMVGVVSQDVKIFNGSLLYNICLSDTEQDLHEAISLCERIGLTDYFKKLPQAYLTIIGEDGINLSGGQRQLVAIARALFNKPQLLLLDEVTSSLDRNSENFVLNLLKSMQPKISVFMITHRIQTARIADNLYILDKGTIAISGTPQELLRSDNFYSRACQEIRELAYL